MTLGKIIKDFRLKNNYSQRQFAAICGVSNGYISMLEEDRNPKTDSPIAPSLATMKKIATAMGMSLNDLMNIVEDIDVYLDDEESDDYPSRRTQASEFAEKIYTLRKNQGLTLEQVANVVGVGKSTVRKWETGMIANVKRDKIALLAQALHVSPAYLMGWDDQDAHTPRSVKIPVYGSVAAGIPQEAVTDIEDYEEIPESLACTGEYAALRINGNSMLPRFTVGDVVIVRLQDDVDSGDIAIVMVGDGEATCKKIKKTREGVLLISTNPEYEPIFFSNRQIREEPVRIWGKVVELRAKF